MGKEIYLHLRLFFQRRCHHLFETAEGIDNNASDDEGDKNRNDENKIFQFYIWHLLSDG